jgi:adenylate kinase
MTQPLNVIMLGAPASGKGTQAERLARARGIPKISTGDILRDAAQAGAPLGLKAKALIDRGELVDDETMVEIVKERLQRPDTASGFILDGFPRTVAQAEALDRILNGRGPLIVVELWVPKEELTQRMEDRRVCIQCRNNADPEAPASDSCARCGGKMVTRADDGDATVRLHRLDVYSRESPPLLDFYRQRPTFRSISGAQSPDQVEADLMSAIESVQSPSVGVGSQGRAGRDQGPSAASQRRMRP